MPLDPKLSLLVMLGARVFPKFPHLSGGMILSRSADEFMKYMTDPGGLGISRSNVLDLFDDNRPASDQLGEIAQFLSDKQRAPDSRAIPENVFVYYVGHGLFTPLDRKYCLAIRCTNANMVGFTAMRGRDLAEAISTHAGHLRRFLILDCCFAGAILGEWLTVPGEAANVQMMEELPKRGTSLLCASSSQDVALAPGGHSMTMFSSTLIKALRLGNPMMGQRMSMIEVRDTVQGILRQEYPNWVRPELHSPDMREGEISTLPLFPNPAWARRQRHQVEEETEAQNELERLENEAEAKTEREYLPKKAAVKAKQEQLKADPYAEESRSSEATAKSSAWRKRIASFSSALIVWGVKRWRNIVVIFATIMSTCDRHLSVMNRWQVLYALMLGVIGLFFLIWSSPSRLNTQRLPTNPESQEEIRRRDNTVVAPAAATSPKLETQENWTEYSHFLTTRPAKPLALSQDGRYLAVVGSGNKIEVWRTGRSCTRVDLLPGHGAGIRALMFNPRKSTVLVSGSDDRTIRIWDLSASDPSLNPKVLREHHATIRSLSFTRSGTLVSVGDDNQLRFWDVSDGKLLEHSPLPVVGYATEYELSTPPADWLCGIFGRKTLTVWSTSGVISRTHIEQSGIRMPALSADGQYVAAVSDGHILVRDIASKKTIEENESGVVRFMAFDPVRPYILASAGDDRRVKLWDLRSPTDKQPVQVLAKHNSSVISVVFSNSGKYIAAAGDNGLVWIWQNNAVASR